ncbi:MAG: hypothetical protein ACQEW8_07385 [Actinomycetota bacterium]
MLKKAGSFLAILGLVSALIGVLWNQLFPTLDANIGAGAMVVIGLAVAVVGALLLIVGVAVGSRKSDRR